MRNRGCHLGLNVLGYGRGNIHAFKKTTVPMTSSTILKQASRLLLLLGCTCLLSSCSAIGSVFSFIITLPITLVQLIIP